MQGFYVININTHICRLSTKFLLLFFLLFHPLFDYFTCWWWW